MTSTISTISNRLETPSADAVGAGFPRSDSEPSRRALWAGRILSGLGAAFLAFDASLKVLMVAPAVQGSAELGWSPELVHRLGLLQVACLVVYLFPRTAVLGAILWTGYLGGAIATHARIGNPVFSHTLFPVYVAALLWLGLWLRDMRLRALVPFSRSR
jgi:hypothetical protein